jgi:putative oxidoreductase
MLHSALYDDAGKLVLRLTLGVLMLFHGIAKLGNGGSLNWIAGQLSDVGLPGFIAYGVYVGEIVAPLMIIAGVYCRIGAAIIILNMLFAIGLAHVAELFMRNEHGGYALELHAFFTFTALALALTGSGRFAVKPD